MIKRQHISDELSELVSWSVDLLGQAIKQEYGISLYERIEKLRKSMKTIRAESTDVVYSTLKKEYKKLDKYSDGELEQITHCFSLMMELINRCENAYRAHQNYQRDHEDIDKAPYAIIMVLTAHPTEARSPEILSLFSSIQDLLLYTLQSGRKGKEQELFHLLMLALKISVARHKKPTVKNEAENIYSYILSNTILNKLVEFSQRGINVSLRAWVGGDKDGHPGVDEKVMLSSLTLSRNYLLGYITEKISQMEESFHIIKNNETASLKKNIKTLHDEIKKIKTIVSKDGVEIVKFKEIIKELHSNYKEIFNVESPRLLEIEALLWIFPAILVPLELREDSEEVQEALKSKKNPFAIERMLKTIADISEGYDSKWYARGFILSMVEQGTDVANGIALLKRAMKEYAIPVVPLFENAKALTEAKTILETLFTLHPDILKSHSQKWGGRYEVMVGYSDSSKENGVLPSKVMISNSLSVIEKLLLKHKLIPVFFHGSGGSIERGGGPINEQTRWLPKSALNIYKATIQGEMVARTFGNDHIFEGHIQKIANQLTHVEGRKFTLSKNRVFKDFVNRIQKEYSQQVTDEQFFDVIDSTTPYNYLSHLKIGSRPTKRATGGTNRKLRAIPWILCWTQTRVLFPTWWGVGTAWSELSRIDRQNIVKEYSTNPVFSSFVHALAFTLAKVELGVFKLYIEKSDLSKEAKTTTYENFLDEYNLCLKFIKNVTKKKELLWFRPWLQESIDLRSSMIHPLNMIQIISFNRNNSDLLRSTVTGISCGMLTTG